MPYIKLLSIPFESETADLMRRVFNTAWTELVAARSRYAQQERADHTREVLAFKVIELVQDGERDFDRLKRQALRELYLLGKPTFAVRREFASPQRKILDQRGGEQGDLAY